MRTQTTLSRRTFLTGLAAVGSSVRATSRASAGEALLFVHGEDRRPMSWIGADGEPQGLKIDILNMVLAEAGIPVRHACLPWARAIQYVSSGEADGLLSVPSAERRRSIKFADDVLIEDESRLYYRVDNPQAHLIAAIRTVEEMGAFKVSHALGGAWTAVHTPALLLDLVPNQAIAFRKLINRRTDIAIVNELAAAAMIREEKVGDDLAYVKTPVNSRASYHIGLRANLPDCESLLQRFDEITCGAEVRAALNSVCAKYR